MSARETGRKIGRRLAAAGIPDADFEAELLVRHASGLSRTEYYSGAEIPAERRTALCPVVKRRVRREPFAYIRGTREFMGLEFTVTPAVLIPRPETEILVEAAVRRAPQGALVADIGTGSGCIAISVAHLRPDVSVIASDFSDDALAVAQENVNRVGAPVSLVRSDLANHLYRSPGEPLVVLANLPYIASAEVDSLEPEVRDSEPRLALDGGTDGLDLLRRLITDCGERLQPALLLLEVAAGQAPAVASLLRGQRANTSTLLDLAGIERVVVGEWP